MKKTFLEKGPSRITGKHFIHEPPICSFMKNNIIKKHQGHKGPGGCLSWLQMRHPAAPLCMDEDKSDQFLHFKFWGTLLTQVIVEIDEM